MITGDLKSQIDAVWNAFWTGGISNPLEVIEQITYLLFIKRLDELHTAEEKKATRLGRPIEKKIFKKDEQQLRWSRFKNLEAKEMFEIVTTRVFPFIKELRGEESSYARHMKDARFTIPTPGLLAKVVDLIDHVPMTDRDTKGDVYEYMLGKIATAGQNGQFRTPRHIIQLMVEMCAPQPKDIICDPACGTAGFLVMAGEYLREHHPEIFTKESLRKHFNEKLFNGYDFDNTMLRIGSMNMLLHGVENPNIRYKDSLAEEHAGDEEAYTLIMANPPFAGSLDYDNTAKDLQKIVKTKKTELLFLALFIRLLKPGGRAAVIVPDGVLFGSSNAHKTLRKILVEEQKLDAVISLPGGVFKPYAGVSTAILLFTKTNSGGTDHVWFYDVDADGMSLDDKRTELLPPEKLGPVPSVALAADEHAKNNLPDVLARWTEREGSETERPRTAQSFRIPKSEIQNQGYDLSLNRYKEVVHEEVEHRSPLEILVTLGKMEAEIQRGMKELEGIAEVSTLPMVRLGQVAEFINGDRGKNYPSEGDFADEGIPFINAGHLTNGEVDFSEMNYINESRFNLLGSGKTKQNDILYCLRGSLGKTAIVRQKRDAAIASSLVIIRPSDDCNVGYLYHFLTSPFGRVEVRKFDNGSSQPNLSANSVKSYLLPLPPLGEQVRIAEVLDRAEALRAKRRATLALLDSLTQSLFLDLFGDPLAKFGKGEHVSFDSVTRRITYGFTCPMKHLDAGIPIITAKNVREGFIDFDNVHHADESEFNALTAKSKPERGDVLITKDGTIGRSTVVEGSSPFCINQSVALVQPDHAKVLPTYIVSYLSSNRVQQVLKNMGKGNALAHLQITELAQLPIPLPPLDKQREFARRLAAVKHLKKAHRASLAELDALFVSLQHRAFKAELFSEKSSKSLVA